MDIFAEFATDSAKETEGVWEGYGDFDFLIARAGNPRFNALIIKLAKQHKRVLDQKNDAATQKSDELMAQAMSETVLLGWRRSEDAPEGAVLKFRGQPVGDYTPAKAKQFLLVKDFREWVLAVANDMTRFKQGEAEEAEAKNG